MGITWRIWEQAAVGCGIWLSGICRSFLPWLLGEEGEGASAIIAVGVMKEKV